MALLYQRTGEKEKLLTSLKKACSLGADTACNALKQMGAE
jgi:hypothetical protein